MVINNPRGTANFRLRGLTFESAGKTGTAQSGSGEPHAWFIGYTQVEADTDLPDIAVAVIVENAGEGSDFAAPIFRALVETYYYGSWQARPWYASDFGQPTYTPTQFGGTPAEDRAVGSSSSCTTPGPSLPMSDCTGLIIQAQSGFFTVATDRAAQFVCQLRGKLKQGRATRRSGCALAIAFRCRSLTDGSGVIESIQERRRAIVRLDPRPRGVYRQVLLANADQAVFVFACAHPEPRLRMLDRFLVVAEKQGVAAIDRCQQGRPGGPIERAQELFAPYESAGYTVLYTSAQTGAGVHELAARLTGKITVLAGPSGAGKSSLLNAIRPGLGLEVKDIGVVNKGQHTTVVRQAVSRWATAAAMLPIHPAGNRWRCGIPQPEELDGYFPEIRPLVADCRFNDCTPREGARMCRAPGRGAGPCAPEPDMIHTSACVSEKSE